MVEEIYYLQENQIKNVKMHPLALVASMAEALERNQFLIATKWCHSHFEVNLN